jgi:hypothetical protein
MTTMITGGLVNFALGAAINLLSKVIPIDNEGELRNEIQQNELIKRELNNAAGYVVLKGGRFVALASCALQVAKHVDFACASGGAASDGSAAGEVDIDKVLNEACSGYDTIS